MPQLLGLWGVAYRNQSRALPGERQQAGREHANGLQGGMHSCVAGCCLSVAVQLPAGPAPPCTLFTLFPSPGTPSSCRYVLGLMLALMTAGLGAARLLMH